MKILDIWPPPNTVQQVSKFFINIGETGQLAYFTSQAVFFCLLILLTISSCTLPKPQSGDKDLLRRIFVSERGFIVVLIVFVLLFRIPLIIYGVQNVDESLWIASAKTLAQDFRPWVSADTGTGGPLIPISLIPLKIFNLPIDHGTLKLMSGVVMALNIGLLYLGFTKLIGSGLARLIILFLATGVAMMRTSDMIAFNSEHIVILLLCISFFFLSRLYRSGAGRYNNRIILLGFVLGLVPYAKLQGTPMALFMGLVACLVVYKTLSIKSLGLLIIFALTPTILVLLTLYLNGGLSEFWLSYIENNLFYATAVENNNLTNRWNLLNEIIFQPEELHFFFYSCFVIILVGVVVGLITIKKISRENKVMIVLSLLFLLVSMYCITTPGRTFGHYMLLILLPLTMVVAFILHSICRIIEINWNERRLSIFLIRLFASILFICITSLYFFIKEFTLHPKYLVKAREYYDGFCLHGDVVTILNRYYEPKDKMAIWGWATELFEGTKYLMGTRDGATPFQIEEGPMQAHYLSRYLKDLQVNKPKIFVETISPSFFRFADRSKSGFENFPLISNYIRTNYNFEGEIGTARYFLRKDATFPEKKWKRDISIPQDVIREFHSNLELLEKNGTFLKFKGWTVLGMNTDHQKVTLALISKSDTLFVDSYQMSNKEIVDFSPNNTGYLMCGFIGYIPLKEIPMGDYEVGLFVENEGKKSFKSWNQIYSSRPNPN
jgi:hypothetical protein